MGRKYDDTAGVKRIFDLPFASLNAREVFRHRSAEEMVANIEFPQNHRRASSRMVSSLILFFVDWFWETNDHQRIEIYRTTMIEVTDADGEDLQVCPY